MALGISLLLGLPNIAAPHSAAASATVKTTFVTGLASTAQAAQRAYGVPASVLLAQAAVNTDYGTSTVAKSAKNLFNTSCSATLTSAQFVKLAEAQVGKRYVLGAYAAISNPNPTTFDCSELVKWLFGRSGNPITDLAASQYNVTAKVTGSPKVGDLVFLRNNPARANGIGHVAVLTKKLSSGDWQIIEAKGRAYGVVKSTLSYWKKRSYYAGLRRYAKLNFAGASGVQTATAISAYQTGCYATTSGGKAVTFRKYSSTKNSITDHASIVASEPRYASARNVASNPSAYVDAIAKIERPADAVAYAKALRAAITAHNLTKYDVVPLTTVLVAGNTGGKVTALQHLLAANLSGVKIHGRFDSATVAAVKAVQKKFKLTVDGEAGPKTLTALMATLKQGSTGSAVSALKTLLSVAGHTTEAGATFGAATTASLKSFQTRTGLAATGSTDTKTWAKLFMTLDKAPAPQVSGTTAVGQKLTAAAGSWGPGQVAVSYQWYRAGVAIPGATSATYLLQPADAGHPIRVITAGTSPIYTSVSRISVATPAVAPAKLTLAPAPKVSGSTVAGMTLTAVPGTWGPGTVSFSFQWLRGSVAIPGATRPTYTLQAGDYQAKVSVRITGAKVGYNRVTKISVATPPVQQGNLTKAPTPTVSGKAAVGQVLTATPGAWTPAPGALSFQWYRNTTPIGGATKAQYQVRLGDAGHSVKVRVTNTSAAFKAIARDSVAVGVPLVAFSTAPTPKITGTAKVGATLAVSLGAWSPAPTFGYQWYRNGAAITSATKSSYKLATADKGKTLTVKVTAKRVGYATTVRQASVKAS